MQDDCRKTEAERASAEELEDRLILSLVGQLGHSPQLPGIQMVAWTGSTPKSWCKKRNVLLHFLEFWLEVEEMQF